MGRKNIAEIHECDKCDSIFLIKDGTIYNRRLNDLPDICYKCMREYKKDKREKYWTDDNREKASEKTKKHLLKRTKEEWIEINRKNSEGLKKHWETVSYEDKLKRITPMRQKNKEWLDGLSPEQRSEFAGKWVTVLTDEEKKQRSEKIKNVINNRTDEENENRSRKLSIATKRHWDNLTQEERDKKINNITKYWEDPKNIIKASDRSRKWWKSLSDEERAKFVKSTLVAQSSKNKLHQKFEEYFNQSNFYNNYSFKNELVLNNNDVMHSWDYGIYDKDNNLVMVIDLDGSYYHADECDYNGIHSREEYDEKRFLSVPDGIKYHIINELIFNKSIKNILKDLDINYDQFINNKFKISRLIPFPFPKYKDDELIRSFRRLQMMNCNSKHMDLSVNTRMGDRLIHHFHESIYDAKYKDCEFSPYEAWRNDEVLLDHIKNKIIYINTLNPNKILQGFNISEDAMKVSVFSAGRAKLLINKYLNEYDTIFDPFSGFSGRMLGSLSLNKNYIGQDINYRHINESISMIKFLKQYYPNIDNNILLTVGDSSITTGNYDCLFTYPPNIDNERWIDVIPDNKTCDDWIDICLNNYKCNKYLFVVDTTEKYKDKIVDIIKSTSYNRSDDKYVILI